MSPGELLLAGCTWSAGVPWGVGAGWVYIISWCPLGSCFWLGVHGEMVSLEELLLAGCTWSDGVPWGGAAGWVYMVSWFPLGRCCWLGVRCQLVSLRYERSAYICTTTNLKKISKFHGDSIKKLLTYDFMCLWVHCVPQPTVKVKHC